MPFKITKFLRAEAQLRVLAKRAAAMGVFQAYSDAIDRIGEHLKTDPLGWGDPEYNTKHPGGVVCHGIEDRLLVHFAVYVAEQVVCLIDIEPLPNSPLAGP